jgi:predicted permease
MSGRWFRIRSIFGSSPRAEVDDEVAFHLEMRARELIDQGVDPQRARQLAMERFGPMAPVEEALVQSTMRRRLRAHRAEVFSRLRQDLRYAIRSLRRSPGFTAAAVATLALGTGAALAVFTVVNGVLLRPLPYHDPSRIAMVWLTMAGEDGTIRELPLSSGFYSDLERESTGVAAIAAFRSWPYALGAEDGAPERIAGARVSPALFDVLGVAPAVGRTFSREEAVPGGPNVAVLSHDLWQRRFGGNPSVVGTRITLSGQSFTVTGVMPPGFAFPRGAELPAPFQFAPRTELWTPLIFGPTEVRDYSVQNLSVVTRLDPKGPSASVAEARLNTVLHNFLRENAPTLKLDYRLKSLADQAAQPVRRGLLILLGAVVFVLLIAAANVASLLVARVGNRQRELAVRTALGAGQGRIARQLVTENVVLAAAGTGAGVVISYWITRAMLALVPGSLPRADDVALDWRVLSAAAAVALGAGIGFGLAASYSVRWRAIAGALHAGDGRSAGTRGRRLGRRALVALEVALSLMLLISAALLTQSFIALQRVSPGFSSERVLTAGVGLPIAGRFDPAADGPGWATALNAIVARIGESPLVEAAGAVSSLPLSGAFEAGGLRIPGKQYEPGQAPSAQYSVVAGRYFEAVGIPVLAGRSFDSSDDDSARATIILNREAARRLFGSETEAVGRELLATFTFNRDRPRRIVGVVENVKQSTLDEQPGMQAYVPESQMTYPGLTVVVRARGSATGALPAIRAAIAGVAPAALLSDVRTLDEVLAHSLARQRFSMTLIGIFAVLALILAVVGLYGVLALIVTQRRREIGVRLALGAQGGDVVRLVLGEGALVTAVGILLGVGGAFAATRVLGALLYGVGAADLPTYAAAAGLVAVVALVAIYGPARRASRVDPKAALAAD